MIVKERDDMANEEWKDSYFKDKDVIYDYIGLYQISNLGRVKRDNKILKQYVMKNGYCRVTLCKNGKVKSFLIHRLVAFMFIENDNPTEKVEVNHINEFEKNNNCVTNLEWCTRKYNCNYGTSNKRQSEKKKGKKASDSTRKKLSEMSKGEKHWNYGKTTSDETKYKISKSLKETSKNKKRVAQYDKQWNLIKIWNSIKEAGESLGLSSNNISNCCNYYRNQIEFMKTHKQAYKSVGKYYWKYYEGVDNNG